ncbi:PFU-domain-containing protein [Aureobasidium subglaciale]|nr:PFU-domain-containing protein [Aureobasidium subglaciale]
MADVFKLSASLKGHEDDVRAVLSPSARCVFSASRDGTVRQWLLTSSDPPTYDDTIAVQATSFVNSLTYAAPSSNHSDGLLVSAGKDTIIDVRHPFQSPDSDPERLLIGHANNVCALDAASDGDTLVSGGWDTQARVWSINKGECVAELKGHDAAVWAVMIYDDKTVITGCADKTIRIFSLGGKLLQKIPGLPDVVRALCKLPAGHPSGAAFASAGNDQVIRLWTLDGVEVAQLHGHTSFIYALAVLSNGDLVSSGEDRTVRVWKGTECVQTITHPAISVWAVSVCPETDDIVTGASDKMIRIFSRDPSRHANPETIRAFDESVSSSSIPQQTAGEGQQINKEQLPSSGLFARDLNFREFLQQKSGTKEGQVQMIREDDGSVTAHTWSSAAQQWINVGTVVDAAASSGRKVTYEGKDYDFVFDVDITDGAPPLKLPYNVGQNPYDVASRFIANNELPMTYLDQVANFITTNTQGATLGSSAQQQTQAPGADPWGSENRYRPGEAGAPQPSGDARPRSLPQTQYLSITTANLSAIRKKIGELNDTMSSDLALSSDELKALDNLVKQLQTRPKDPKPQADQLSAVLKVATTWPSANRLPGIDLLRLSAVAPSFAMHTSGEDGTIVDTLCKSGVFAVDTDKPNNAMLAIRVLANLFMTEEGRLVADGCFEEIVSSTQPFASTSNKNLATAIATLYINYAVLLTSGAPATESKSREQRAAAIINASLNIIKPDGDSEAVYRALVAVGTLMSLGNESRKEAAQAKDMGGLLQGIERSALGQENRIKAVTNEMRDQLK